MKFWYSVYQPFYASASERILCEKFRKKFVVDFEELI